MRAALACLALLGCSRDTRYEVKDFSLTCLSGLTVRHSEQFETERWDFVLNEKAVIRVVEFADNGANRSLDGIVPIGTFLVDGARCEMFPANERNLLAKCRVDESRSYAVVVEDANERTQVEKCVRTLRFVTDAR